jgi:hypothetical protein
LVEGKGAAPAGGDHPNDALIAQADEIGVFGVEFIHQAGRAGGLMLRDFLHERSVIELMDLLKFPVLSGDFELQ